MLTLITGPMFSEKTTTLIGLITKYKFAKKQILIINHLNDNRYDEGNFIVSHNNVKYDSLKLHDLNDITDIDKYEAIFIDEGQFFTNLVNFVKKCLSLNKKIYVAGLNGDLNQKRIGEIQDLLAYASKIILLSSICNNCGNEANYSKLKTKNQTDNNVIVGSADIWEASCFNCLHN